MSQLKKLQEATRQGVILERDRVMRILQVIATNTKKGLDKKLMSAGEKHIAEIRFKLAEALIGAVQMKVMSGEDPKPNAVQQGPGSSDSDDNDVDPGA